MIEAWNKQLIETIIMSAWLNCKLLRLLLCVSLSALVTTVPKPHLSSYGEISLHVENFAK
jgi:hypothetical protein